MKGWNRFSEFDLSGLRKKIQTGNVDKNCPKPKRQKPKKEEMLLQTACVNWFRCKYPQYQKEVIETKKIKGKYKTIIHIVSLLQVSASGGSRNAREGANMKRAGLSAGIPDLMLAVARGGIHGVYFELKKPKTETSPAGKLSKAQEVMHQLLKDQYYGVVIIYSVEQFIKEVENYLSK